jgi:indolepyruvate ferredoxin oxidoreductase
LLPTAVEQAPAESLEDMIARRADTLTAYQDAAYARRYRTLVETAQSAEAKLGKDSTDFAAAVARNAFKVMAYKDEYEVARLHREASFTDQLKQSFSGDYSIRYHLAPPLFSRRDPHTGLPRKSSYGPWLGGVMKMLAGMKGLRDGRFDIFGRTAERRAEKALRDRYVADIEQLAATLTQQSLATAIALAKIPEQIRGFGHIKEQAMKAADSERERLMGTIGTSSGRARAA